MSSYEEQYSALLRNVLSHGAVREDRTGVGTFSMFAPPQLRIDLREGFPMLTTRKMGWKRQLVLDSMNFIPVQGH
jgi:thymidylate synthase